ncbi:MAG: low molecular weight phosphotyrosine protein phosphatase, partial [Acidimicrobiales bacterium]
MRVLFVCTGNICRSPMAEGMLRARAAARGIAVEVASVGLIFDGRPATDEAVRTAHAHGVDISAHRSSILESEAVDRADLVIGMERQHVREAVVLSDGSLA